MTDKPPVAQSDHDELHRGVQPPAGQAADEGRQGLLAGKDLPIRTVTAEEVFPAEAARKVLPTRKC